MIRIVVFSTKNGVYVKLKHLLPNLLKRKSMQLKMLPFQKFDCNLTKKYRKKLPTGLTQI